MRNLRPFRHVMRRSDLLAFPQYRWQGPVTIAGPFCVSPCRRKAARALFPKNSTRPSFSPLHRKNRGTSCNNFSNFLIAQASFVAFFLFLPAVDVPPSPSLYRTRLAPAGPSVSIGISTTARSHTTTPWLQFFPPGNISVTLSSFFSPFLVRPPQRDIRVGTLVALCRHMVPRSPSLCPGRGAGVFLPLFLSPLAGTPRAERDTLRSNLFFFPLFFFSYCAAVPPPLLVGRLANGVTVMLARREDAAPRPFPSAERVQVPSPPFSRPDVALRRKNLVRFIPICQVTLIFFSPYAVTMPLWMLLSWRRVPMGQAASARPHSCLPSERAAPAGVEKEDPTSSLS